MSVQGIGTESDPAVPCKGLAPFSLFFARYRKRFAHRGRMTRHAAGLIARRCSVSVGDVAPLIRRCAGSPVPAVAPAPQGGGGHFNTTTKS